MHRLLMATGIFLSLCLAVPAWASGMIKKESPYDVQITLDRLERVLKARGIRVVARIDHAAAAKAAGEELLPTQLLIFGNPKLGTPLMNINREVGFDLPLKALAWKDDEGKVWLGLTNPADINQTYALAGGSGTIDKMDAVLKDIMNVVLAD